MNETTLESLLIDQALGELPDEVSELLDAYLAQAPERRLRAEATREALGLARSAVAAHPELFGAAASPPTGPSALAARLLRFPAVPALKAAAGIAALALAAAAGYQAGHRPGPGSGPGIQAAAPAAAAVPEAPSPWARYQVGEGGRLAVVTPSDPHPRALQ